MRYYVNKIAQRTGEHEVHAPNCPHPPDQASRRPLGDFTSCRPAVIEAKKHYTNVDGCYYCCRDCHTR